MSFNITQNRYRSNRSKVNKTISNISDEKQKMLCQKCYDQYRDEIAYEDFLLDDLYTLYTSVRLAKTANEVVEVLKIHKTYNPLVEVILQHRYSPLTVKLVSQWRYRSTYYKLIHSDNFVPNLLTIIEMYKSGEKNMFDTYKAIANYMEFYNIVFGEDKLYASIFKFKPYHNIRLKAILQAFPDLKVSLLPDRSKSTDFNSSLADGTKYGICPKGWFHVHIVFDELGSVLIYSNLDMSYTTAQTLNDKRIAYVLAGIGLRSCVVEAFYGTYDKNTKEPIYRDLTRNALQRQALLMTSKYPLFFPTIEMFDIHESSDLRNGNTEPPFIERYNRIKTYFDGVVSERYKIADIFPINSEDDFNRADFILGDNYFAATNK